MPLSPGTLGALSLLRGIPDDQLQKLGAIFEPLLLPDGEVLFREGDEALAFYVLTAGEVAIREGDEVSSGRLLACTATPRRS
jgi:CRP-like cAMP-binding protein